MIQTRDANRTSRSKLLLRMLLMMLFPVYTLQVQANDWMKYPDKFSMSNSVDHVTFNVFLCDLDNGDTYAKSGGITAVCGGEKRWLMDLWYINEGSNENPYGKVHARYCIGESRAWFTNGFGQAEQEIKFSGADFLIQKWPGQNHYCTASIDYYFPASMAGKEWTFYYEYRHNHNQDVTMTLGTAYLSNSLGLSRFNTSDFQYERTSPDKIKFTVPALPDDIPSKLSEVHIRQGQYKVNFTYTKQDGTILEQTDLLECEKNNKKSFDIAIPEEVGNPKKIDMKVQAIDGLKDSKNYYWKYTDSYNKTDVFKTAPVPNTLTTEYRQFDKAADLSWNAFSSSSSNYLECTPYVYRMETNKNGEPLSGSWNKRGTVDNAGTNQALAYHDNGVNLDTYYKYMVLNVPKDWIGNGIYESSLNSPTDDLLARLGYVESELLETKPLVRIYSLSQDTTVTDKVVLTWQYSRIPTDASTVTFKMMRRDNENAQWTEYGNISGDSQPTAGSMLTFTDTNLPNVSTRYQYMVRLEFNGNNYDSDPIYAGLLSGTRVKTFEATKGTHEGTVRLSWTVKQVGTENTVFDISRRYVNSDSEYIHINTTTGTSDRYTYEDNTVQPGYYYEYKIEAYSGNVQQNTLTDAGFCQARGVISGRVSFGSGSAVEDVRLTLRASDTGTDNCTRSYSQRIDGATTGITWDADSTDIAKVFGAENDFSVQMFIRPDDGLQEGAVVGEIPGVGKLIVGSQTTDGYKLLCQQASGVKRYKVFSQINKFKGFYYSPRYSKNNGTWNGETVYGSVSAQELENQIHAEGYQTAKINTLVGQFEDNNNYIYLWLYHKLETLETPIAYGYDVMASNSLYDLNITLPAGVYSLLTVESKEGELTFCIGDVSSSTMNIIDTTVGDDVIDYVEITPACQLYNGEPVSFEGSYVNALPTMEDKWAEYMQPVSTSTQLSNESIQQYDYHSETLSVGGAKGVSAEQAFKGNFTEVRVWNHILSDKEKQSYKDRVLNGRETGLMLYWPMDEGLDRYVFDMSYSNDMPNGRHAKVGNNITASTIIPQDHQLSRYDITNANGEYIIRGIPFVGSGSTYTVIPTRGIHEFSPISRNGFIGNGSLTLNSYDFTDVSSFPVKGKVTYLNTNIPVDSVQFMIDGALVQSKEGVHSDSNGDYEISVPIGEHLIECYMNGHRFTSFPKDGSTYDFKRAETVNFTDSTLVNVTGRVNGGFSDQAEPVGFRLSTNRIGTATIKLSLGKESQCSFNYYMDDRGEGHFGTENLLVESATDSIKSTSYRAGGEHDDTYYIYIKTDEKTGEFSAMLPPLKYKVESITFDNDRNGDIYNDKSVFAQNLPVIDASNAIDEKMLKDTITIDGDTQSYKYSAKMIRQYRANPTISVVQAGMRNGAFGEPKIAVANIDHTVDSVQVVNYTADGYEYVYGYPLFQQGKQYDFDIDVYEYYVNLDNGEEFKEIPQDAVFNIMNDASGTTTIYGEKATIDGEEVEVGVAYNTLNIQGTPDEKGHISYQWEGGFPNLAQGNLRNLSIGVKIDGRTTMWQAPNSAGDALDLIILGSIGSGTNFVTSGPQTLDMIIRRPPGSTSVATLTNKTITTKTHIGIDDDYYTIGGGVYLSETPTFEFAQGITSLGGITLMNNSKWKVVLQQTEVFTGKWADKDLELDDNTYSVTEAMTTPGSMVIDYATGTFKPEGGDTYIGRATNLLFAKGRILNLFKQDDGTYKLQERDGITVSQSFGTKFVYPQAYILNTLIPNWEAIIKSKLEEGHIAADHWNPDNLTTVPGKVIYYTKYSPGDEQFGKANGDINYWSEEELRATNGFPSYRMVDGTENQDADDEVEFAINQIKIWKERIADNEEDKVTAFNNNSEYLIDNYSIASGSKVSMTTETSRKKGNSHTHVETFTWSNDHKYGPLVNDAGVNGLFSTVISDGDGDTDESSETNTKSVAWTMSDGDLRTALSVDVYNSPSGWGPIFRTRGGQTANPYEGETRTMFYTPVTTLNEATMRIEKPELKVLGASEITDVPTGGQAQFTLQLSNQSETNEVCTYVLYVKDGTNPNGAKLYIDGMPLSVGMDGRTFKMKGNETIEKTLEVRQGDRSVTDYENIVLVLRSEKDVSVYSDDVTLLVHFVPASSFVELSVDHTILNKEYRDENNGITATMSGLDRQDEGLQGIRLRYRRKGTDTWTVHKQWSDVPDLLIQNYYPMPEGSTFTERVAFSDDGTYELQAQTFGLYGNDEVTYESNIIEVMQDTHGPKILGMVSPEDGQLTYLSRNNMHLRFNEVLNSNALSKSDNFTIEGGLNNVIFGGNPYPDVAVQLNGNRIETDAMFNLSNSDYALDLWFYRQGDGTIISIGTDDNQLSLSTHDDGILSARIGTDADVYDTNVRLPKERWMYMALDYKRKDENDAENRLNILYVTSEDNTPVSVANQLSVSDLSSNGKLGIGGDGMQGMMAKLTVWESNITATELYETRSNARPSYTSGLMGCWEMDEGHGTIVTDRVRSRHIYMESESWYINNENRAAHLDGSKPMRIDIATFNPAKTDNYAIEFWFRGVNGVNDPMEEETLLSVLNGINIGFQGSAQGNNVLMLKFKEHSYKDDVEIQETKDEIMLSNKEYKDGYWHHFALNVRRGTSAIAYIDGEAVKVIPEEKIPGISGKWLLIGGEELMEILPGNEYAGTYNNFTGDIDEIRIWSSALDGKVIKERMYERLNDSYAGLVGYFPMESIRRVDGNITTFFSKDNYGESDSRLKMVIATPEGEDPDGFVQSVNAPALLPGSTRLFLDEQQYNFTASSDQIYFSFPDSSLPQMDSNDFVATVKNIKDEHGNKSETVQWMFHTDFAAVKWGEEIAVIEKNQDESVSFQTTIVNQTGGSQNYEISGLPTWMSVDNIVGTINGSEEKINFTISSNVPVGRYTQLIYLTDRLGIQRAMTLSLIVRGDEPNWSVDPNLYESNMTLTGQIYIGDKVSENTDTKIAAFDEMGLCRGVGSPTYISTRDAYYVDMVIYGAAATELSSGQRDLNFKMYDASTGTIYSIVYVTLPGHEMQRSLVYAPDANYGSYNDPVIFHPTPLIQQPISLAKGWTWMSVYVDPLATALSDILPKDVNILKRFKNIKSKTAFATVSSSGEIMGELQSIEPGKMYKMQLSVKTDFAAYGIPIDVSTTPQTISAGYNWIGSLSSKVMSPDEAFAELVPLAGDRIKNRTSFAEYSSKGYWEGTLKSIVPGEGYIYHSTATVDRTFHYPEHTGVRRAARGISVTADDTGVESSVGHFTPVDDNLFPDNMSILAVVKKNGENVNNAEVGAFINGECRGAIGCNSGYYFLTVMGSSETDIDSKLLFKVYADGEEYEVDHQLPFISDAFYGSLEEPYVLDLDAVTGICTVSADDADDDDGWYTLQGVKLHSKPAMQGVYIHRGKKITILR